MGADNDVDVLSRFEPAAGYFPPQPLYLPSRPMSWALDRIETAIYDIRMAEVAGWRSALADTYRAELDDLVRDIARTREHVRAAERSYEHLRYVARMNGER